MERFSIDTSRAKSNSQVVSFCAQQLGIQEFNEPTSAGRTCDIYWHSVVYPDMKDVVKDGGRVNKFPGMSELAKKVSLTEAIRSMRELFPDEYAFYPQSWVLPAHLDSFKSYCTQQRDAGKALCFIVKPDEGAQGTGIYLICSYEELKSTTSRQLVQEYVTDPYLLPDGLKFDLRVYAVIKSINPLSIYVAREGMARFCTEKYVRPSPENFDNFYAHLTNYSLNKANDAYVHSHSLREQLRGEECWHSTITMEQKGVRTRRLWKDIKLIIAKTVLAMVPEIMLNYEHHFGELRGSAAPLCFQIMGFDILIRQDGIAQLLEVNSAPSLTVEHNLTKTVASKEGSPQSPQSAKASEQSILQMIKVPLVRDCLLLVLDQLDPFYSANATKCERKKMEMPNGVEILHETLQQWDILSVISSGTNISAAGSADTLHKAMRTQDDLGMLRKTQRPHLSEVFPDRYGQVSKHLLILDRAVYLKCQLSDVMPLNELEAKFNKINTYFNSTGKTVPSGAPALPFHGFLKLFFHIAKLKFLHNENGETQMLASVVQLFAHCDSTLRRYGVRSTRLRRAEFVEKKCEQSQQQQQQQKERVENRSEGETDSNNNLVRIYLLPSRIPRQLIDHSSGNIAAGGHPPRKKAKQQQQSNRTRSLPRKFGTASNERRIY
uniref:Tubulin tyrosine ligase-like family, member 11 n=1 Tax=Globodera pallida TaxID=36090 RepID=A0A183BM19_GLOPA